MFERATSEGLIVRAASDKMVVHRAIFDQDGSGAVSDGSRRHGATNLGQVRLALSGAGVIDVGGVGW